MQHYLFHDAAQFMKIYSYSKIPIKQENLRQKQIERQQLKLQREVQEAQKAQAQGVFGQSMQKILVKTYIKDNYSNTNYKYFVNNEQNLIDCGINTAKRMDSQTWVHAVLFKGAHSFNDWNSPCNQNIINVNQYNSQERKKLDINIVHYVNSQEFTFNW
ncbi:Hypothetical_protein [Hexamita inflata]|uniref:Hypothetical_protein n=1 Tax=Hexamita inflata TaxID=28002 RepID=A0AA86Q9M6_9EUKA|nr:Hypothetical protein HINF_LOCUS38252 [Hexamita inflata]CAI9952008.1 Hypothetical protein HINF_LOCUS39653 [Hexamita inflata]CAI9952012.1 Hypothetical protein HINF_LOCUS39657 [Hexamita inflata]CAI9952014.1 Hypothetical protein HINF_LOCUS39659 [Hexamita inflata]CAI9952019.1 Hypothetical protein HINF_LOCUS39664 [Hexamita inflata]